MNNVLDAWSNAKLRAIELGQELLQIDKKYQLIAKSDLILELGSAPGGCPSYSKRKSNCKCISIRFTGDEKLMGLTLQLDLYSDDFKRETVNYLHSVDLILSDMSVNLSGIKIVDEEGNKNLNFYFV